MPKTAEHLTPTRCADCPLRPLEVFRERSPDVNFLQDFKVGELVVSPGTTILAEDSKSTHLFTILLGWAFRYRTLADGRRQIINYALPGDFVGLQASLTDPMSHGVEALTDIVLCVFPRDKLWNIFTQRSRMTLLGSPRAKNARLTSIFCRLAARRRSNASPIYCGSCSTRRAESRSSRRINSNCQ
jgi:CRP-like cAMP-binding protein